MHQLRKPLPDQLIEMRGVIERSFNENGYSCFNASDKITGRDFLQKIWEMILSVPVGIAVMHEAIGQKTMANLFFELGLMQACGKDTLVIKSPSLKTYPSDLARTEYVEFDEELPSRINCYCKGLADRAEYYLTTADQLENNPILALDYLRRAYLLTPDESIRKKRDIVLQAAGLESRAKNSVEQLAASF